MLKRLRKLFSRSATKPDPGRSPSTADTPVGDPAVVQKEIPREDLDHDAVKIVQRLTRFDHQAYLVGGCVRDLLVGLKPKDFDVGTSATPRQVRRLFRNCRIIGRRFRLAHVYFQDGKIIEVATFRARTDANDDDQDLLIRDDNLFGTPAEDALRRDFTVNQLFYDVNRGTVVDHAGGLEDLDRKRIRTIGDPVIRFREDPIRILRAIRFAARLGFHIERRTLAALEETRDEIPKAAPPRILEEINKFCRAGHGRASFEMLRSTGVFSTILPEFAAVYQERSEYWTLLFAFLDKLDARVRDGEEAGTGVILACLLLPILREGFGWQDDGSASPPRGLQVREQAEPVLRPLSLRLRVARKDQEHCRQILLTLYRLIPISRLRRGSRQSIARRTCLADAQWMLSVLADSYGGEFSEAWESIRNVQPVRRRDPRAPEERPGGSRRGRGSRGGRRRRGRGNADDSSGPQRQRAGSGGEQDGARSHRQKSEDAGPNRSRGRGRGTQESRERSAPPPPREVGDDYFFSALPTVPDMPRDGGDRYGAADRVAGGDSEPSTEAGVGDDPTRTAEDGSTASPDAGAAGELAEGSNDSGSSEDAEAGTSPSARRRRRRRRSRKRRGGEEAPRADGAETAGEGES